MSMCAFGFACGVATCVGNHGEVAHNFRLVGGAGVEPAVYLTCQIYSLVPSPTRHIHPFGNLMVGLITYNNLCI